MYIAIYIHRLFSLMITINIVYSCYSFYCLPISVIVYYFPLPVTILDIISTYLVCSKAQHEVTITRLGNILYLSIKYWRHLGRQSQIQPFVLTLQHNSTLSTDKTSRKCVLFLQSTPPQNWIHLSVYHSRSDSYQDHCSAVVTHL